MTKKWYQSKIVIASILAGGASIAMTLQEALAHDWTGGQDDLSYIAGIIWAAYIAISRIWKTDTTIESPLKRE